MAFRLRSCTLGLTGNRPGISEIIPDPPALPIPLLLKEKVLDFRIKKWAPCEFGAHFSLTT